MKMTNYKFRSSASSGLLSSLLVPLCLLSLVIKTQFVVDKFLFALLTWLLFSYLVKSSMYVEKNLVVNLHNVFYTVLSIPASIFISWFTSVDIIVSYVICVAAILTYNYVISKLIINCPGSFTMGEAQVVVQGIFIFIFYTLASLKQEYSYETQYTEAMNLLKLLLLGLFLLVCCLYIFPTVRRGLQLYFVCFSFAIGMMLIWSVLHYKNPVLWLLEFCTYSDRRVYLFLFWLISTLLSISFVIWINRRQGYIASTMDRKYFHIIITVIYLSGVIYDVQFLCFASGIVLGAFIVLEIYRILEVPVIGPAIKDAFQIFLDEKDSGVLILTHMYLLIGCSCPIWLSACYVNKNTYHICLLSGVISVGIGDTCAAVGGTLFGGHQWKGSKKTFEGTACAIVSQLICSFLFLYMGHCFSAYNISLVVISCLLTSLLEAQTTQVDNLILPLFMFIFMYWIQ